MNTANLQDLYYRLVIWYGTDPCWSGFEYAELAPALRMLAGFVEDPLCAKAELWEKPRDKASFSYVRGGR